jgi:hypothetical protein
VSRTLLPVHRPDAPTTVLPVVPQEAPRVTLRALARLLVTRHPWVVGFCLGGLLLAAEVQCTPFIR